MRVAPRKFARVVASLQGIHNRDIKRPDGLLKFGHMLNLKAWLDGQCCSNAFTQKGIADEEYTDRVHASCFTVKQGQSEVRKKVQS